MIIAGEYSFNGGREEFSNRIPSPRHLYGPFLNNPHV